MLHGFPSYRNQIKTLYNTTQGDETSNKPTQPLNLYAYLFSYIISPNVLNFLAAWVQNVANLELT